MESIKDRIYFAACKISNQTMVLSAYHIPSVRERILDVYVKDWESGEKFYAGDAETAMDQMAIMFGQVKREAGCDEEKEINAAAERLVSVLREKNVDHWLSGITREQMVSACNALGRDAFVSYSDERMSVVGMARRWNDVHKGEENIIICADD